MAFPDSVAVCNLVTALQKVAHKSSLFCATLYIRITILRVVLSETKFPLTHTHTKRHSLQHHSIFRVNTARHYYILSDCQDRNLVDYSQSRCPQNSFPLGVFQPLCRAKRLITSPPYTCTQLIRMLQQKSYWYCSISEVHPRTGHEGPRGQ